MNRFILFIIIFIVAWYIATGLVITYFNNPDNFFLQLKENLLNCNHIIAFILGIVFVYGGIFFGNSLYKKINNDTKNY
jgi:predicted permease